MNVLIVEDDHHKLMKLCAELERFPMVPSMTMAGSLRERWPQSQRPRSTSFLLDMAIPSYAGGPGAVDTYSQPVGGLDVPIHLAFNDSPAKIIIVTQYPTIEYNRRHVPLKEFQTELSATALKTSSPSSSSLKTMPG